MANSWHAKQGQSVHSTITVSTGTQTQSTAAAGGASSDRPHKTKLGHYYSVLCTCVHMCMCMSETEKDRGIECLCLHGWLPTSTVYAAGWLLCCIAGKFKHGEHTLRK